MSIAVGIHRNPALSPGPHCENDAAILAGTMASLVQLGWEVRSFDETRIEAGEPPPAADLYLNMCQSAEANGHLIALERRARFVNRPSSALDCHRVRLVERLAASDVPFAPSRVVHRGEDCAELDRWIDAAASQVEHVWLKRGDVHAEGPDDVRMASRGEIVSALEGFFRRSIASVVAQRHIEGPLIKFYGIGGGAWFRWFEPEGSSGVAVDEAALRAAAFGAAACLRLEVFGGDAILEAPDRPVLIDVNDWPSFARFRREAAAAIATYVHGKHLDDLAARRRAESSREPRETP